MSATYHKHEFIEIICYPRNGPDVVLEFKVEDALILYDELRDALIDSGKITGLKSTEEERVGG